ncbi:MAG: DUF1801 domain-containing protein [Chloroflexi bacterium]|nr:DUF1801 domain-containing protein [Chloroflexota bacterium]
MPTPASTDAYMATLTGPQREVLEEVRATIRAAAPDATETISYQMPAFTAHGRALVSYAAFTDHWSLFPMGGAAGLMESEVLAPYWNGKGTLRFAYDEPVPSAIVARVVEARLAENAARSRR